MAGTVNFTNGLFSLLGTLVFWIILGVCFLGGALTILIIRRKRKLNIPYIELLDIGRGKVSVKAGKKQKAGWFKHHSTLFGLWDYGYEEICKTKDKRIILNVSAEDYHDINGTPGLILQRSPEDPNILVPVTNAKLINGALLNTIAPAEFRGVAVDIIRKGEKETSDRTKEIVQWVLFGGTILFALIAIILIVQMVNSGQDKASALILQAGQINSDNLKTICANYGHVGTAIASGAP